MWRGRVRRCVRLLSGGLAGVVLVLASCSNDDEWLNPETRYLTELDVLRADVIGAVPSDVESFGRGPNRNPYRSTPQYASATFTEESTGEGPLFARVVTAISAEGATILGCSMTYQGRRFAVHGETRTESGRDARVLIYAAEGAGAEDPRSARAVTLNVQFRDEGEQAGEVESGRCPDWLAQHFG